MAFQIIRNDITKVKADAIVNTANPDVAIGEGVDSAIYKAAGGTELLAARKKVGILPEGTVGVTPAFNLDAKYIIHASGPWWDGGEDGEQELLRDCYDMSLMEAHRLNCESIAFPLLSTGTYGFPRELALRIAIDSFSRFLEHFEMEIYLVVFDKESVSVSSKMFKGLQEYVDENYVKGAIEDEYDGWIPESLEADYLSSTDSSEDFELSDDDEELYSYDEDESISKESLRESSVKMSAPRPSAADTCFGGMEIKTELSSAFSGQTPKHDLDFYITAADDPFCQYLQRLINKKGFKNSEVWKKANLSKQYFSKLMNAQINPTKGKLLSIAIALQLNMDETKDMLMMAGYAMSPCNKSDLVVAYFIRRREYNMFEIEIALYDLGLPTLSNY